MIAKRSSRGRLARNAAKVVLALVTMCAGAITAGAVEPDIAAFRGQLLRCAIADLDKAEALLRPLPWVSSVRGLAEHAFGRLDRAVAAYDRALHDKFSNDDLEACRKAARIGAHCPRAIDPKTLIAEWYSAPEQYDMTDKDRYQLAQMKLHVRDPNDDAGHRNRDSVREGRQYLAAGRLYEALVMFDLRLTRPGHHAHAEAILGRGNVFAATKRYQEAIAEFSKAIKFALTREDRVEAMLARYLEAQRKGRQRSHFGEWLRGSGIQDVFALLVHAYESRALAAFELGRLESALDDFNRVLALLPKHIVASSYRDELLRRLKIDNNPVRARPHGRAEGGVYARLARLHAALSDRYSSPPSSVIFSVLVDDYMERGLFDIAIALLYSRMRYEHKAWQWHADLAKAYAAKGDTKRALQHYNGVIAGRPAYKTLLFHDRAVARSAEKQYDLAIADFSEELADSEFRLDALYLRALAHSESGSYLRAVMDLAAYIEIGGRRDARAYFQLARIYAMHSGFRGAVRNATRAVEVAPKYARAYELRALIYYTMAAVDWRRRFAQDKWNGCAPPPE